MILMKHFEFLLIKSEKMNFLAILKSQFFGLLSFEIKSLKIQNAIGGSMIELRILIFQILIKKICIENDRDAKFRILFTEI